MNKMSNIRTGNPLLMKRINEINTLRIIKDSAPISTSQLCEKVGMKPTPMMRVLRRLEEQEMLSSVKANSSRPGINPTVWSLNKDFCYSMGVYFEAKHIGAVMINFRYENIYQMSQKVPNRQKNNDPVKLILNCIEKVLSKSSVSPDKVKGIGLAVSGVVDVDRGIILQSDAMGEKNLPIKDLIESKYGIPAEVENDPNVAILGEKILGQLKGAKNAIYISHKGSAAIMVNGNIYRGENFCCGETTGLGYYKEGDIVISMKKLLQQGNKSFVWEMARGREEDITEELVLQAAKSGDVLAGQVVDKASSFWAGKIAEWVALLDPKVVLLGYPSIYWDETFICKIREAIEKSSRGLLERETKISFSQLYNLYGIARSVATIPLERMLQVENQR